MQFLGGHVDDLIVLVVFIYLFLMVRRKVSLSTQRQAKFENFMQQKRGKFFRIVVYAGTALFAFIVLADIMGWRQ
ncbi:MAG TPA: hypothetical protein VFQ86_12950 [Arachidicoccus soli]|uniref:Uncharacterized protein n=1 Tax=Arachidicoccus soli TaxID=2341117 RepID=A0A386HU13_9BACT|nr:hypothetical protein [Arachidicoccus soli]AYD49159.1 hypothetical protein D6B99_16940 [Arachidicoccus soli]HEU0228641.1 hypothetical protein [Arachidicoccus soli]